MVFPVVGQRLVELGVLFLLDVVGVAHPDRLGLVQLLVFLVVLLDLLLLLLVLVLFGIFVVFDVFDLGLV